MTEAVPTSALPRVPGVETLAPEAERTRPSADASLVFDNISKAFPDGTVALVNVSFDVRPESSSPSSARRAAASRRCCGSRRASPPTSSGRRPGRPRQPRLRLPGPDAAAVAHRPPQRRAARRAARRRQARAAAASPRRRSTSSGSPASRTSTPSSCRAACGCAPRSPARSPSSPNVFLFDEPFGALDEITRERLNDELLALFASQGLRRRCSSPTRSTRRCSSPPACIVMSGRPGRIVGDFDVPFEYPRDARPAVRVGVRRADRTASRTRSRGATHDVGRRWCDRHRWTTTASTQALRRAPTPRQAVGRGSRSLVEVIGPFVVFVDRHRRLVLHLLSAAEASPAIPDAAARTACSTSRSSTRDNRNELLAGSVELDEGRDGRPGDRDRARHALRHPHEPGEVDRALALPLCRGAADDPDPRPRAADRRSGSASTSAAA